MFTNFELKNTKKTRKKQKNNKNTFISILRAFKKRLVSICQNENKTEYKQN